LGSCVPLLPLFPSSFLFDGLLGPNILTNAPPFGPGYRGARSGFLICSLRGFFFFPEYSVGFSFPHRPPFLRNAALIPEWWGSDVFSRLLGVIAHVMNFVPTLELLRSAVCLSDPFSVASGCSGFNLQVFLPFIALLSHPPSVSRFFSAKLFWLRPLQISAPLLFFFYS